MVTVDTIVAGNRVRDLRNGLSIPPALTLSTVASVAMKPSYWYHLLAGPALDYANFAGRAPTTVMKTADFFDADLNWSDIEELRSRWAGRLLLKGPIGPADARRALELGVDGEAVGDVDVRVGDPLDDLQGDGRRPRLGVRR